MVYYQLGSDLETTLERLPIVRVPLNRKSDTVCDLEIQRFEIFSDYMNRIRNIISIQCSGSTNSKLGIAIGKDFNRDEYILDIIYKEGEEEFRYSRVKGVLHRGMRYGNGNLDNIIDCRYLCGKLPVLFENLERLYKFMSRFPGYRGRLLQYKPFQKILKILEDSIKDEAYQTVVNKIRRGKYIGEDPSLF